MHLHHKEAIHVNPVRFNPTAQRLVVALSLSSGRLETRKWRIATILLLLFSVILFTSPIKGTRVLAERAPVVVVGSTGAVDEEDLAEYEMRGQQATIKQSVETATVTYRYNLPGVYNFDNGTGPWKVRIRYRDTGPNQEIIVRLRAANLEADGNDTIYSFNSDSGSTGGGLAGLGTDNPNVFANQTFQECDVTLPADHITHGRYGYFLEVELRKVANDGTTGPVFIGFVMSDASSGVIDCGSVAA
jgi:hypothetical protein